MSKYFYLLLISIVCLCTSCEDKLFDFDIHNLEANGDWGIPLIDDDIVLEKFLNKLDSVGNIHTGADGSISIVYETSEKEVFNFNTLFNNIAPSLEYVDTSGTIPEITSPVAGQVQVHFPNLITFSLASSKYKLNSAEIETGILDVYFSLPSTYTSSYTITLTSEQIVSPEGHNFSATVTSDDPTTSIDLAGYSVILDDRQRVYLSGDIILNHPGGTLPAVHYSSHLIMRQFQCNNVRALVNPYAKDFVQALKINLLNLNKFTLDDAYFNEPKITIHTFNSFCNANCNITQAETVESSGVPTSFLTAPCTITVPYSSTSYSSSDIANLSRIRINSNTDSLRIGGTFTLNPAGFSAGEILFENTATYRFKATTELPLNVSLNNAVYSDVKSNNLYHFISEQTISSIEEMTIRLCFTNTLPLDLYPEIGFIDTVSGEVTPLNLEQVVLHGSYDGKPVVQNPIFVTVDPNTAVKIINSHKFYLYFHINTQGHDVVLKTSQSVKAKIGAKVKYSNIVLH